MNNKTFFIVLTAIIVIIGFCIWLVNEQSKLKQQVSWLQENLNSSNDRNHYLSHQNQALLVENNNFKRLLNRQ